MIESTHVTIAAARRTDLFADEARARAVVRRVLDIAAAALVVFHLGGDHLHLVLAGTRDRVRLLTRSIVLALGPLVECELAAPRYTEVSGRKHMEQLVPYVLSQGRHHGHPYDDATWTGSCFPMIVGAAWSPHAWGGPALALHGVRASASMDAVHLPRVTLDPAPSERLRVAHPILLVKAAAAASFSAPDLSGGDALTRQARRTVLQLGVSAGIRRADLAEALGVSPATATRLIADPPNPELDAAVLRRVALDDLVERTRRSQWLGGSARPVPDEGRFTARNS